MSFVSANAGIGSPLQQATLISELQLSSSFGQRVLVKPGGHLGVTKAWRGAAPRTSCRASSGRTNSCNCPDTPRRLPIKGPGQTRSRWCTLIYKRSSSMLRSLSQRAGTSFRAAQGTHSNRNYSAMAAAASSHPGTQVGCCRICAHSP